jgi:simple sugar transport system substrate-binding protein
MANRKYSWIAGAVLGALLAAPMFAASPKTVVFIPKLVGIPWFNSMEKGLKDYAAGAGGALNVSVAGAPDTDPAAQARIIEDAIAKKPDCIIVVPNDTNTVEPLMKKGMDAGILMLTQEAVNIKNAVADIEFLILAKEGKDMMDLFVNKAGKEGGYAVMVGGLTVEGHNQRADAMVKYQEQNFPKLHQVTSRLEGSENVQQAHDKTLELMTAYPDLKGIIYIGSLGGIGGAQAVAEKNLTGKFTIVGACVPSQAKKYLKEGTLAADYIGNPYRIGKDTGFIVQNLLNGKKLADLKKLPEYGEPQVKGKIITFHADSEVTAANADAFGF